MITKFILRKSISFVMAIVASATLFTACEKDNTDDKQLSEYVTNQELENLKCYTDLHLHLDGSITVDILRKIAAVQDIELTFTDEELRVMLQVSDDCSDLNEYLEKFPFPLTFLQCKEGLSLAVELVCKELEKRGHMYAELRYAPQLHCDTYMTQRDAIEAAIEGTKNSPIPVSLILCCMRGDDNHDKNIETIELAAEYLNKGVGAVDIAGAEALFPTQNFADLFALAREKGIPFTIHAGEADGPASVYKALEYGKTYRSRCTFGRRRRTDGKAQE